MTDNIATIVRERVNDKDAGKIFTTRDFEDVHNDKIVIKTLSRMSLEGRIHRLARGLYVKPKMTKFGMLTPSLDDIANAIAKKEKVHIIPTGDTALNILGLSTQVPMKAYYLTDGSGRKYKIGNRAIVFKSVVPQNFQFNSRLMPLINVALKQLGEHNITDDIVKKIKDIVEKSEPKEKTLMLEDISLSPRWIKERMYTLLKDSEK